jgi:hypothetical protein
MGRIMLSKARGLERHDTASSVPETRIVESPPLVVDPVAPAEPITPVPKPSPKGSSEFWTHVIR